MGSKVVFALLVAFLQIWCVECGQHSLARHLRYRRDDQLMHKSDVEVIEKQKITHPPHMKCFEDYNITYTAQFKLSSAMPYSLKIRIKNRLWGTPGNLNKVDKVKETLKYTVPPGGSVIVNVHLTMTVNYNRDMFVKYKSWTKMKVKAKKQTDFFSQTDPHITCNALP